VVDRVARTCESVAKPSVIVNQQKIALHRRQVYLASYHFFPASQPYLKRTVLDTCTVSRSDERRRQGDVALLGSPQSTNKSDPSSMTSLLTKNEQEGESVPLHVLSLGYLV
jgi:hypothetical protein